MRDLCFKAKSIQGEWVESETLIQETTGVYLGCRTSIEINPETLCQYIGKCDKNGNKIFEGDIIRSPKNKVYDTEDNVVVFENCGFVAKCKWLTVTPEWFGDCEIIGNIFDKE